MSNSGLQSGLSPADTVRTPAKPFISPFPIGGQYLLPSNATNTVAQQPDQEAGAYSPGTIRFAMHCVQQRTTFDRIGVYLAAVGAPSSGTNTGTLGVYRSGVNGQPEALHHFAGTLDLTVTGGTGWREIATRFTLEPGLSYWAAYGHGLIGCYAGTPAISSFPIAGVPATTLSLGTSNPSSTLVTQRTYVTTFIQSWADVGTTLPPVATPVLPPQGGNNFTTVYLPMILMRVAP